MSEALWMDEEARVFDLLDAGKISPEDAVKALCRLGFDEDEAKEQISEAMK